MRHGQRARIMREPAQNQLERSAEIYLQHLVVERGLSANTVAAYRRDIRRYTDFLASQGITQASDITPQNISAFQQSLRDGSDGKKPLAARSAARTIVAVRGMHTFWALEGITADNPAADIHPNAVPQQLPKALSVPEVARLIDAPDTSTPGGLRDRALIEFLYATGARASEAVGLDVDDLSLILDSNSSAADLDEDGNKLPSVVRVRGKGDKERYVPLGSYAVDALNAYLVRGRPALAAKGKGSPALFLNQRGGRLSRQSVFNSVTAAASKAKLTQEISPHTLRHSFATHLISGGADVRVVQELLGHASVTTTQVYTMVTAETLREVFATSHPRAR